MAARLQRYEELLHRHGIKFDELDEPSISGSSDVANTGVDYSHSYRPGIAGKDGVPLYPHKYVIFMPPTEKSEYAYDYLY